MLRKIIKIDGGKCSGCGLCAQACHEGAIGMVNGKAALLRDDCCDGLGNCLPVCPTGAITFEEREAAPYKEEEVKKNMERTEKEKLPCGCLGASAGVIKNIGRKETAAPAEGCGGAASQLAQWPVQIKLVPADAPYFENADLLVSADCAAYAYGNFHGRFMKNRITLIGCPKLDGCDYAEKLTEILKANGVKSVTVVRMEVPCCGGIESAVKSALKNSGKMIPRQIITISRSGEILD